MTGSNSILPRSVLPPLRIPVVAVPPPPTIPAPASLRRGLLVLGTIALTALAATAVQKSDISSIQREATDVSLQSNGMAEALPATPWHAIGPSDPALVWTTSQPFTAAIR